MTDSTIAVRDNTTGSSKTVATKLDGSSNHLPIHVVLPAAPADIIRGMVSVPAGGTQYTLFSAPTNSPDLSYRNYVSSIQVANKGGTGALVGIYDGNITSPDVPMAFVYVPATSTASVVFQVPLRGSVAAAITVEADATSTIFVSGQGFVSA